MDPNVDRAIKDAVERRTILDNNAEIYRRLVNGCAVEGDWGGVIDAAQSLQAIEAELRGIELVLYALDPI